MKQSDARIKYLEEKLEEPNKKVHSKLPFICEQTAIFVDHFFIAFALLHRTDQVSLSICPHIRMMQLWVWCSDYQEFWYEKWIQEL
jgi:hypothetical protein